jgi:probable HAF family extracellular repeat protein
MVTRARGFFIVAPAMLAIVAQALVACGDSENDKTSGDGSNGGSGDASGGASGAGGPRGGSTATGGGGGSGVTGGASGDSGRGGDAGGGEESASFHWIEPTEEHQERAAAQSRARLRTTVQPAFDDSVLVGMSTVITGDNLEAIHDEGIVWTEATGTTALGGLPGVDRDIERTLSNPSAASADGSVVVGNAPTADGDPSAFRWTRTDGMEAIAGGIAAAVAVSADGSVVLGSQREPMSRAFRWTRDFGAVALEPLGGDDATEPLYLSPDGATVLAASTGSAGARLFSWTEASGTRAIDNLPGYTTCRQALPTARLSYGFVAAGSCRNDAGGTEPFVWVGGERLLALGSVDALDGFVPSEPVAVSADGSVAVGGASDVSIGSRPYRWTEAEGLELIELPAGFDTGAPVSDRAAMSEDGTVVVGTMGGSARRSFLWSESSGAVVLEPLEGHDISDAYVVSADGSVAAGSSFRSGTAGPEDMTAVYWRADGVARRLADELGAAGFDLGGGALGATLFAQAPRSFVGYGSSDEVSYYLGFRARLP